MIRLHLKPNLQHPDSPDTHAHLTCWNVYVGSSNTCPAARFLHSSLKSSVVSRRYLKRSFSVKIFTRFVRSPMLSIPIDMSANLSRNPRSGNIAGIKSDIYKHSMPCWILSMTVLSTPIYFANK